MNIPPTSTETETALVEIRTSVLLRISSAIETAVTLDELLLLALNEVVHLLNIPLCGVFLLDDDGTSGRIVSTYPPRVVMPPPVILKDAEQLREVLLNRRILQIPDVTAISVTPPLQQMMDDEQVRTLVLVPLIAQDRAIGALGLATRYEVRPFSESDLALARLLAGQLAAAIVSFRITEAAQRRSAELATLNDIAAAVTSSLDKREVYHLVVEKLNEYFRVEAGSLLMRDDETGDLEFVMTLEAGEEKLAGVRVPRGQGVVGYVAENQIHAIVHDPANDPRFYSKVSEDIGYDTRSILCVPMLVKGRSIGVIELLNKRDGSFTEEDGQRLTRMAATIGVAIENARLFQQVTTVRDRLEAILNSTNDGILMADTRGAVVTANPTAAQIFQMPKEQIMSRQLTELVEELRTRAIDVQVPRYLNEDSGTPVVELELSGAAQRRFVRHLVLPVRDASGAEIGRLALFQDISKERELAQMRDDYTGMLVHDMRAPLTAVMNGIMMVKRGLGGPVMEKQHELLNIAHQGSQTMLEMVNTLLDIAKMEQGRMTLDLEPLSPYGLVDETIERLGMSTRMQSVRLEQQLAVGLPLIEADREKVVRVLQNLLDNAIKFSPSGREVILGASYIRLPQERHTPEPGCPRLPETLPLGDWMIFWVRDQGPGIPAQYHERIFEKFGQVRGRKVRGTGLGLTFCKLVVEAHAGQIWLESQEGRGSSFALALPLSQDAGNDAG